MEGFKMVLFEKYCPKCKNEKKNGDDYPCSECLMELFTYGGKPDKWEEKK